MRYCWTLRSSLFLGGVGVEVELQVPLQDQVKFVRGVAKFTFHLKITSCMQPK